MNISEIKLKQFRKAAIQNFEQYFEIIRDLTLLDNFT